MAQVGRKRKLGPRHRGGKLIQPEQIPDRDERQADWGTPEIQSRRIAVFGNANAREHPGELHCPADLLAAGGRIDTDQFYAARKAKSIYARYTAAVLPPRVVAGQLRDFIQGSSSEPMTTDDLEEAKAEFEQMRRAILREVKYRYRLSPDRASPAARQAFREVHALCQGHATRNLHALKLGLDALIEHYDLAQRSRMRVYRPQLSEAA